MKLAYAATLTAATVLALTALGLSAASRVAAPPAENGAGAAGDLETGDLEIWVTHGLDKVRPADPPGSARRADLSAARNEFEPFQVVLRSPAPIAGVDARIGDLVAEDGGHRIDRRHATVYRVGWLDVETPSSEAGDTGEWPDPLLPRTDPYAGERRDAFPFDLPAARNQPLWLEVYVPPETPPGAYRGTVEIAVGGAARAAVPVSLEVWPFTLPSTSSLRTSFGFSGPTALKRHHGSYLGDDELHELTGRYAEAALRHRISLHGGSMAPPEPRFDGSRVTVDWTRYDREVGPFLEGTVFGADDPLPGARATSTDVITAPGLDDTRKVLYWRAWADHFRRRGWLDRLFLYLPDEPGVEDYPEVARLADLARRADPELPTLLTEQLVPELAGRVDLWTTLINCLGHGCGPSPCERSVTRRAYTAAEDGGAELWWYQSCASHGCGIVGERASRRWPTYVIDAPATAARIMPWLAFTHDVEGELYYNTVEAWTGDGDPWTDLHRHGGNGDGTLFYPGAPERIGGRTHVPVESLRLKLIRDGLEDYEYLTLLAAAGGGHLARAESEEIAPSPCRWRHPPEAMLAAREALARELARRLAERPGAEGRPS